MSKCQIVGNHVLYWLQVYLTKRDGEIVANPLAFIVYIDKPEEKADEYPAAPAILAGVLVCIIVFLALFIPFVTRAKRRRKEGKPVFKVHVHFFLYSSLNKKRVSMH